MPTDRKRSVTLLDAVVHGTFAPSTADNSGRTVTLEQRQQVGQEAAAGSDRRAGFVTDNEMTSYRKSAPWALAV
jgi:hypothetical protein